LENMWGLIDRVFEIIDYTNYKYLQILEEVVVREAEILSKDELSEVDKLKLMCLRAMKEIIAEELGLLGGESEVTGSKVLESVEALVAGHATA